MITFEQWLYNRYKMDMVAYEKLSKNMRKLLYQYYTDYIAMIYGT